MLVVGAGNSASEIALDLLGVGDRETPLVRTPRHIVRRDTFGVPSQLFGIASKKAPTGVTDRLAAGMRRVSVPDVRRYGLPRTGNPISQFRKTGTVRRSALIYRDPTEEVSGHSYPHVGRTGQWCSCGSHGLRGKAAVTGLGLGGVGVGSVRGHFRP